MIKFDHLPLDLVFKAWDLNFKVKIADDPVELEELDRNNWAGYCNPNQEVLVISGSIPFWELPQVLAHEIGHAQQWREGVYYRGTDNVRNFEHEMDAVKRGEKLGIDMRANREANYHGYADVFGIIHLGRS